MLSNLQLTQHQISIIQHTAYLAGLFMVTQGAIWAFGIGFTPLIFVCANLGAFLGGWAIKPQVFSHLSHLYQTIHQAFFQIRPSKTPQSQNSSTQGFKNIQTRQARIDQLSHARQQHSASITPPGGAKRSHKQPSGLLLPKPNLKKKVIRSNNKLRKRAIDPQLKTIIKKIKLTEKTGSIRTTSPAKATTISAIELSQKLTGLFGKAEQLVKQNYGLSAQDKQQFIRMLNNIIRNEFEVNWTHQKNLEAHQAHLLEHFYRPEHDRISHIYHTFISTYPNIQLPAHLAFAKWLDFPPLQYTDWKNHFNVYRDDRECWLSDIENNYWPKLIRSIIEAQRESQKLFAEFKRQFHLKWQVINDVFPGSETQSQMLRGKQLFKLMQQTAQINLTPVLDYFSRVNTLKGSARQKAQEEWDQNFKTEYRNSLKGIDQENPIPKTQQKKSTSSPLIIPARTQPHLNKQPNKSIKPISNEAKPGQSHQSLTENVKAKGKPKILNAKPPKSTSVSSVSPKPKENDSLTLREKRLSHFNRLFKLDTASNPKISMKKIRPLSNKK